MLVDNEVWTQVEVPVDFQIMVNKITKSNESNVMIPSPTATGDHMADLDIAGDLVGKTKDDDDPADKPGQSNLQSFLLINKHQYHLVTCSLLLIKMLDDYVTCATNMTSITTDVMNRLVELIKVRTSHTN